MIENLSQIQAVELHLSEMQTLVTREGKTIDITGDKWLLPIVIRDHSTIDFGKVPSLKVRNALKYYVSDQLRRISTSAGHKVFHDLWRQVFRNWKKDFHHSSVSEHLIDLFEKSIICLSS